ncbi:MULTISPECIES: hypothetical protein [Ectothiorhodospira]|uniref:hypothetical protein n=1 Tax=Ectothiorhodospira TaxID=1051 RepID=UPI001EE85C2E|nr:MULTISPECIES: hypothetical protein [Ectothiorhodospira]MCG5496025.1 hypothetical protein [Ectothiorhodospira variabilis]MCG5499148.1 hypothetical protein [Ectothiorhodospira variabilis]MCG5505313.1 hypothetical protein [Ectothiorhodospira variabilis]MCG5508478.1 hypothetical protein [Ectothiorhodospira variabilis]MCG5525686.1 hypothetical protein [Ectothiorhodospira haloalkaliphila]
MSEYQYYEFTAVDRSLSVQEQTELRRYSSRARITPGGFVNEYHWGDLKADPLALLRHYFDAHVYSANWGTCRLLLRLPRSCFEEGTLADYAALVPENGPSSVYPPAFRALNNGEHWILEWWFNDESRSHDRFWIENDGPGWMTRLLPLREELLRGDTRPLYLGWLARVSEGEFDAGDSEPPLPAGLGALTPAQKALADFLLLDSDLIASAAVASPELPSPQAAESDIDDWLATQAAETLRAPLRLMLLGRSSEAERRLRGEFLTWQRTQRQMVSCPARRTLTVIESGVEMARSLRLEREREAREAEEAKQKAERASYLAGVAKQADRAWHDIDALLQRRTGAAYDEALQRLQDLAEALHAAERGQEFRRDLEKLLVTHAGRPAWMKRLDKAGLLR